MFARNEIGVLAGIEDSFWTLEKIFQVSANFSGYFEVALLPPERVRLNVCPQILSLHLHDLFEMRMFPIAVGRILEDAAPDRIDQLTLRVEGRPGHSFRLAVATHRFALAVFNDIPIEIFLDPAPALVFGVIVFAQDLAQANSLRLGQIAILVRLERRFSDDGRTRRGIIDNRLKHRSHRLGRDVALALYNFAAF